MPSDLVNTTSHQLKQFCSLWSGLCCCIASFDDSVMLWLCVIRLLLAHIVLPELAVCYGRMEPMVLASGN